MQTIIRGQSTTQINGYAPDLKTITVARSNSLRQHSPPAQNHRYQPDPNYPSFPEDEYPPNRQMDDGRRQQPPPYTRDTNEQYRGDHNRSDPRDHHHPPDPRNHRDYQDGRSPGPPYRDNHNSKALAYKDSTLERSRNRDEHDRRHNDTLDNRKNVDPHERQPNDYERRHDDSYEREMYRQDRSQREQDGYPQHIKYNQGQVNSRSPPRQSEYRQDIPDNSGMHPSSPTRHQTPHDNINPRQPKPQNNLQYERVSIYILKVSTEIEISTLPKSLLLDLKLIFGEFSETGCK